MGYVTIRERKFTYKRLTMSPTGEDKFRTVGEVEEFCIAHTVFISRTQEGLAAQFGNFTPDGNLYIVKYVERIQEIDGGVEVDESAA
jgi:hypothetical protein